MPEFPQRQSPRLKEYDYTLPGAYFVTICQYQCIFGRVANETMEYSAVGRIVVASWQQLPRFYPHVEIDCFVVMPNHTHAIIVIQERNPKYGLPEIVKALKTYTARQINKHRGTQGLAVWQRSYHDHIIRNEAGLNKIREYVYYNPAKWQADTFYEDGKREA